MQTSFTISDDFAVEELVQPSAAPQPLLYSATANAAQLFQKQPAVELKYDPKNTALIEAVKFNDSSHFPNQDIQPSEHRQRIELLLSQPIHPWTIDSALAAAASYGNIYFIDRVREIRLFKLRHLLCMAAENGQTATVVYLCSRVKNPFDDCGLSLYVSSYAMRSGSIATYNALLDAGMHLTNYDLISPWAFHKENKISAEHAQNLTDRLKKTIYERTGKQPIFQDSSFEQAVENGWADVLQLFIADIKPYVNTKEILYWPDKTKSGIYCMPLERAAMRGYLDVARILLELSAKLIYDDGPRPLFIAMQFEKLDLVKLFVKHVLFNNRSIISEALIKYLIALPNTETANRIKIFIEAQLYKESNDKKSMELIEKKMHAQDKIDFETMHQEIEIYRKAHPPVILASASTASDTKENTSTAVSIAPLPAQHHAPAFFAQQPVVDDENTIQQTLLAMQTMSLSLLTLPKLGPHRALQVNSLNEQITALINNNLLDQKSVVQKSPG